MDYPLAARSERLRTRRPRAKSNEVLDVRKGSLPAKCHRLLRSRARRHRQKERNEDKDLPAQFELACHFIAHQELDLRLQEACAFFLRLTQTSQERRMLSM